MYSGSLTLFHYLQFPISVRKINNVSVNLAYSFFITWKLINPEDPDAMLSLNNVKCPLWKLGGLGMGVKDDVYGILEL